MATHIYREKVSQNPHQTTHKYEEKVVDEPITRVVHAGEVEDSSPARVLYILLNAIEILLAIRFLFRLFAANPGSPFVSFIYSLTEPLVAPFRGIFPAVSTAPGIIEWSTVIAMLVYAAVAYLIVQLIYSLSRPSTR